MVIIVKRKWLLFFLIVFLTPLLTSCWSKKELTDLALVSALGIDKTKDGKYLLSFQILNPGTVAGSLQGGGGGTESPPVTVYKATGDNLTEASRRASGHVSRRLYYAHTNLVVIGEKMAREEGVEKLIDGLDRDPEFRTTATFVIANGSSAADLVETLTPVDKIPSDKINKTLEITEKRWGHNIKSSLKDVMVNLKSPGKGTLVSGFKLIGNVENSKQLTNLQQSAPKSTLRSDGIAVLKDGKLIDWLYGDKARGTVWVINKIHGTDFNIDWNGQKEAIAYQTVRQKTKISTHIKNGIPTLFVHSRVEGDISELDVPVELSNPTEVVKIQKALAKQIESDIDKAIQSGQRHGVDYFGFGSDMYRNHPQEWKKIGNRWNSEYFPKATVKVSVEAYVRRTGLRNKSFLSK